MPETVEYAGIRWRRYPNAKRRSERVYFRATGHGYLHRRVWADNFGPIPEGCHIHHRDGDPLNNDPANLACVTPKEHIHAHLTPERIEASAKRMEEIRPLTKEWHRSAEGREWHRKHGKQAWAKREPVIRACEQCGNAFESISRRSNDRFCSNPCKSAWRRAQGVDDEDRICAGCGKTFRINRYSKSRSCSRTCAWKLRRR